MIALAILEWDSWPISQYACALVSEAPSLVLEILLSTGRLLGELSLHDAADL